MVTIVRRGREVDNRRQEKGKFKTTKLEASLTSNHSMVKQSRNNPSVAQKVSGVLGSQISMTFSV